MTPSARTLARASVLALVLALGGCRHAPQLVVHDPVPADAWGLAVYPVGFRFAAPSYQAYARGIAVAERASALTGKLVYGPGEFRIERMDDEDLQASTNLITALKYSKARRPDRLLGLRVWVERRVTSGGAVVYDTAGKARGGHHEDQIDVVVHADLLAMGGKGLLAEVQGLAHADPFAEDVEKDPFPDVTKLTGELVDALLRGTGLASPEPVPDLGLKLLAVPGPALRFALPGLTSFMDDLERFDPLEQDSRLLAVWHQRDPADDRSRIRLYRGAASGLVVLEAKGVGAHAGLATNDLILTADGEALTGRHVLERHLALGTVELRYKRAGEEFETKLAKP